MLTSEEIADIVDEEIRDNFDISNLHRVDLKKCLIKPIRQRYISSLYSNVAFELWTVLEETEDRTAYKMKIKTHLDLGRMASMVI